MSEKSLIYNLILKTEPLEDSENIVEVNSLDIDFDIQKSDRAENNKARVVVWNLDETSYQTLVERDYAVCLYSGYGEDEPTLIFRGYIKSIEKKNDGMPTSSDIPTVIELVDGKNACTNSFMNKNYRESVTSTAIIKDCVAAMGLSVGKFDDNIPQKNYYGYKAVGYPHVILQKICTALGIKFSIQNGLVHILSPNLPTDEDKAFVLNLSNSARPRRLGNDEIMIPAAFIPQIGINDSVKCEFSEFSGIARVGRIHAYGNNYGKAPVTEIFIKTRQA